jgi:pyruvate dehydrogenase E1 component beta subunit
MKEEVPEEEETLPLGESQIVREGKDLTLVCYGAMVRRTLEAARELDEEDGVKAEVIDLLSLSPLDHEKLAISLKKTGRAVVVHEAPKSFGPGAEVVARLVEKSFLYLEAPVARVAGYDVHVPYFAREQYYLPNAARIKDAARRTLNY